MGEITLAWEEVGSNGYRCPECGEVFHFDMALSHYSDKHQPSATELVFGDGGTDAE